MTGAGGHIDARALDLIDDALELPPAEREAWVIAQAGDDPALRDRTLSLLRLGSASLRTGGGPMAAMDEALPERIGAYRITGLIGQGGMGAVYRGERDNGDFDHVAAIKLIRPGALSDSLVERFRRERQTLARLSHPHIARLFDGGETPEGQPYLVMEYVEGLPLGQWLIDTRPGATARLALFLKICAAVAYAHRNLIIHRDLTPPNILVDRAGEPKVIDFGIARPVDAPGGEMPAQTATPGFAAPERLTGAPATTLSDIYALGVLLNHVMGAPLSADLNAIIARASAIETDARYPTVEALIDDIERFQSGRAVNARGSGFGYRVRRFVGRHRLAVAAASAALVLLIGALIVTLIANRRAEIARAEAERRFEQTRAIAKTMIFDAYDQVSRVPGSTRARETLARAGLTYLRALAEDPDAPFALRLEAGQGYARLANVIGSGQTSALGRLADGGKLLDRAEAMLARTHRERPADAAARRAYAALLADRSGVALYDGNDIPRARAAALKAQALILADRAKDGEAAALYLKASAAAADTFIWEQEWARAKPFHEAAERFAAMLPPALLRVRAVRMARAGNLRLYGETLHKLSDGSGARAALDRAVAMYESVLAADPGDPEMIRAVAVANRFRAVVHRSNYRDALAAQSVARAAALTDRLRAADPDDAASARMWVVVAELQSQTLTDARRYPEAFALHRRLIAEYERLIGIAGDAAGMRRNLSSALRIIGGNYYNGAAYADACAAWDRSLALIGWLAVRGQLTPADTSRKQSVDGYIAKACNPPRPGLPPDAT